MTAEMRVENVVANYRIKVRNLSSAGMMGAGNTRITRGSRVTVTLRGSEPITGCVAWVQGDRFGVAFDSEVDCAEAKRAYFETGGNRSLDSAIVEYPQHYKAAGPSRRV